MENNSSSKVVIVAFDFDEKGNAAKDADEDDEREILTQVFVGKCKIPAENLVDANNSEDLYRTIREGLDPQQYSVTWRSDTAKDSADFGDAINKLPPGNDFKLKFADIETQQPFTLGPGDFLKTEVNWRERRIEFIRDVSTVFTRASQPSADPSAPWKLRVLKAEREKYNETDQQGLCKATLNLMLDHDSLEHAVRQPAEVEFRITSRDKFRPKFITEQYRPTGAPAYELTINEWPLDQKIHVESFWKMRRTTPEQIVPYPDLPNTTRISEPGLPEATLTTTLRDGTLEVRLTPIQPLVPPFPHPVQDVRIEIGSTGELTGNENFRADDVLTTIHRTEAGVVIYEFHGEYTPETLADRELAFTSRKARMDGAIQPATLIIEKTSDRDN